MTGGTGAAAPSQQGGMAHWGKPQEGGEGTQASRDMWRLGFLGPLLRHGPALSGILTFRGVWPSLEEQAELPPCLWPRLGSEMPGYGRPQKARVWRPSLRLPGLHGPGAARAAAVVVADAGRPLPMGRLRGLLADGRGLFLPLSAQRARGLFPPGRRGRSRAAGWRGRTPGSAGCGTRRGSAAPASGPRPWVAPWDAETPCCAAGRAGPGLGSGCPRRERGSRAGGNARPGSEMAELGGKAGGPGGGGRAWKGGRSRDPGERHQRGRSAERRG